VRPGGGTLRVGRSWLALRDVSTPLAQGNEIELSKFAGAKYYIAVGFWSDAPKAYLGFLI